MGDSGSLIIGLIMYVLSIGMIEQQGLNQDLMITSISRPVLAMAILAYPLLDTIRVFTLRALKGTSPFSADRNHLHHHLLDLGLSHKQTVLVVYAFCLIIIALVFLTPIHSPNVSFLIVGVTAFVLTQCIFIFKNFRKVSS
jgi:UDP-GlcNAc:undecaprenyl-phosphate GlcNAc-1-phosphate transferase